MYNLPEISEPVDELEQLVRKERDAQIQRRFHMLYLLKSGEVNSRSAAARHLGVHRNTVADWLSLYEEGGLQKIQEIGEPGPEPGQQSIPDEAMEALKDRLAEPEGFGSYKKIQQWLTEEHGVELPYSTVHGIVRYQMEAKPKSPSCRNSCTPAIPKKPARPHNFSGGSSR
jgi:transposase